MATWNGLPDNATIEDVHVTEYVRRVLDNMYQCKAELVRIGVLGTGQAPNYRFEDSGGVVSKFFNGMSHKTSGGENAIEANWSTRVANLDRVKKQLGYLRALEKKAI